MKLSVIICAYTLDRWEMLTEAVASCHSQSRPPDEVIVVIDYNDELRARAVREFTNALVIENTMTKGLSGARNSGVVASSGDVLVFLDDDAYGETEWLERLTEPFSDPLVAGCGGWITPRWVGAEPKWFPRTFLWILGCSYDGLPPDRGAIRNPIGANMALRRAVFTLVGGFSSGLGRIGATPLGCEETELCIRYGVRRPEDSFVLVRDAVVHHHVPPSRTTWKYFVHRCWSEGLSKAAVASLVGHDEGLSAERRHVAQALPREVVGSLRDAVPHPLTFLRKLSCIAAGSVVALAGLVRGSRAVKRNPVSLNSASLYQTGDAATSAADDDWRPISIVKVDVDDIPRHLPVSPRANNRVWIELTRQGQILGRQVLWARDGEVSSDDLDEVAKRFESRTPSFVSLPDERLPPISVVIPTICRFPSDLHKLVESISALDYPQFEVIVVDNRVTPDSDLPDLSGFANVVVVSERIPGASAARNRGIRTAAYDIVAFTDDDVSVDSRWLRAIGGRFAASPEISVMGGLVLPATLSTPPQLWFEEFYGGFSYSFDLRFADLKNHGADSLFPYAPGMYVTGCNMAFRKSVLEEIGGFRLTLGPGTPTLGGEDLEILVSLAVKGAVVAFEPAALVRHFHRQTEEEFMTQVSGYGAGLSAMYFSIMLHNPKLIFDMARHTRQGLMRLKKSRTQRSPSVEVSFPETIHDIERRGMAYGPLALFKSWWRFLSLRRQIEAEYGRTARV